MHLDARDFSANPGDQVNKFKEAIAKQAYFQAMLDQNQRGATRRSPLFAANRRRQAVCDVHTGLPFYGGDPMNKLPKEKRDQLILVGLGTLGLLVLISTV